MADQIEPMYTEAEAAKMIGVKPRSLRTERENGRIGFKRVAGKVMYRLRDIVAWQMEGERCQEVDQAKVRGSSSTRSRTGSRSGTSSGPSEERRAFVQQGLETVNLLTSSSHAGSSSAIGGETNRGRKAHVIPLR